MSGIQSTDYGTIVINKEVIAKYAGSVAIESIGIVGMASVSVRDGLVRLLRRDSLTKGIDIEMTAGGKLTINFHVIVAYGVNILSVSDNLMDNVKYIIEDVTGLTIDKINVFVEGVRVID
jgi:uncharacterized alkaline shock family protein YloU